MANLTNCFCMYSGILLLNFAALIIGDVFRFQFSGDGGEIKSPHYPDNYPINITCIWTLNAAPGKIIRIAFIDFHLEKNKVCKYDYVQIREFFTTSRLPRMSNKYCGAVKPPMYISSGNRVEMRFVSDAQGEVYKGFKAVWKALSSTGAVRTPRPKPNQLTTESTKAMTTPPDTIKPCPTKIVTVTVTKYVNRCSTPKPCNCRKYPSPSTMGNHISKISNNILNQSTLKPLKYKCPNSVEVSRKGLNRDGNENLAITFGCLLIVLIITNVALVIVLCKKEGRLNCSLTQMKTWITRKPKRPVSPRIYIPSLARPTLRMVDGEIVVMSREGFLPPPQGTPPSNNGTVHSRNMQPENIQTGSIHTGSLHNKTIHTGSIPANSRTSNTHGSRSDREDIEAGLNGDLNLRLQPSTSSTLKTLSLTSKSRKSDVYLDEEEVKSLSTAYMSDASEESDY